MSSDSRRHPAFPTGRIIAALTATVVGVWLLLRLLASAWPAGAIDAGALAAACAAAAGLLPVAAMARGGVMPIAWGYFIGAAGRVVIAILALLLAARRSDLPVDVMAVALMAAHLPLLAVEAAFVGRYLWRCDERPRVAVTALKGNA